MSSLTFAPFLCMGRSYVYKNRTYTENGEEKKMCVAHSVPSTLYRMKSNTDIRVGKKNTGWKELFFFFILLSHSSSTRCMCVCMNGRKRTNESERTIENTPQVKVRTSDFSRTGILACTPLFFLFSVLFIHLFGSWFSMFVTLWILWVWNGILAGRYGNSGWLFVFLFIFSFQLARIACVQFMTLCEIHWNRCNLILALNIAMPMVEE